MAKTQIERLEQLHRQAQANLALTAAYVSHTTWPDAKKGKLPDLKDWANRIADDIIRLRALGGDLVASYYQLARWLETGYSLGEPLEGEATGAALLSTFVGLVEQVAGLSEAEDELALLIKANAKNANRLFDYQALGLRKSLEGFSNDFDIPDREVKVDRDFRWPKLASSAKVKQAIVKDLIGKASNGVEDQLRSLDSEEDSERVLERAEEILTEARKSGASNADYHVMNGARQVVDYAHSNDKRILLYARGTSGNPCAFCAMLASRGFVYWSSRSASRTYRDGGMRSYHDNCHCFPIARWSKASQLPELNAYFERMWPEVTGDATGKEKLRVWRRWINQQKHESRSGYRTN